MEFRVDFFFRIVMDVVYYAINLSFYKILFLHTDLLGGWSESQMMVFVAGYLFVDALNMTVIGNNMWYLPIHINRGELDYHLTRPVSPLFFLSLRDFAANSFVNLLMTFGILVWAVSSQMLFSMGEFFTYLLLLILGTYLYYLLRILLILPVFWIHSGRGLESIFWGLARFMERPDGIFSGLPRKIFTMLLPFTIIASFPARFILEPFDSAILLHFVGVIAAFSGVLALFWRRGLRAYSSASS
jgi:ABC-2 type transport system permease protein